MADDIQLPPGFKLRSTEEQLSSSNTSGSASPPQGFTLREQQSVPKEGSGITGALINPLINALPARAVAADIYGLTHPLMQGQLPTSESFEAARKKSLEATELPESSLGKSVHNVLAIPGEMIKAAGETGGKLVGPNTHLTKMLDKYGGAPSSESKAAESVVGAATDVAGLLAPVTLPERFPGRPGASKAEVSAARAEQMAREKISTAYSKGLYEGGPTAADVEQQLARAKAAGQPFTLSDIESPELKAFFGSVYRLGGEARARAQDFLSKRNVEEGERVRSAISDRISGESAQATAKELLDQRSAKSNPLYEAATEGGSLAPLTHQFEEAYRQVSSDEAAALSNYQATQQAATLSAAKQSRAGADIYASASATKEDRAARVALDRAKYDLDVIRNRKAAVHARLQKAQADGTANAPGAVWSPRLQEYIDDPDFSRLLGKGFAIERRVALGTNKPYRPTDYAIIGRDINGDPIVGSVPNMRVLIVAKEGLDKAIEENTDKETGRLTKDGRSYLLMRNGLVRELDRLNPAYKSARDMWNGLTASYQSIEAGKRMLNNTRFKSLDELREYINSVPESDREFMKIGLKDDLEEKALGAPGKTSEAARVLRSQRDMERIKLLFGDEAAPFVDAIIREQAMHKTPGELYGGSQTRGRTADDARFIGHIARVLAYIPHVLPSAIRYPLVHAVHAMTERLNRPNEQLNAAVAKLMTDPNIQVQAGFGEPLLAPSAIPQAARRGMSPIEAAILGAGVAQTQSAPP